MSRLGIVTGWRREAQCLVESAPAECPVVGCAGANAARARAAAATLVAEGCDALLSFGIAGGLDPQLQPGDAIVAESVVAPTGRRFATMDPWRHSLSSALDALPGARIAMIAGSDTAISTIAEKQAMHQATGAVAVDMESHALAEAAANADLPFLALRVVADTFADPVPRWLERCVDDQGDISMRVLVAGFIAHPLDIPALVRLAKNSGAALAGLRRASLLAGPRFRLD